MQLDTNIKNELKEAYHAWSENKQAVKDLNHSNSELLKEVAGKLDVQKSEVTAAFRFAKKAEENGHDELESITDIFETMKS